MSELAAHCSSIDLFRRSDGRLMLRHRNAKNEYAETPVVVACAFPWSRPWEFISIRDDKGKEMAMIDQLDAVAPQVRSLIEEELKCRNFIPRIVKIDAVTPEMEFFYWKVLTSAGPRSILTKRHELPRTIAGGSVLIKDVGNDLYLIEKPKALDPKSKKLLWVYLD